VLLREGNQVVRVASAAEARTAIARALPDLIILDMVLPDESGIAVCAQLRGEERTAAIPIVMITGYSDQARHAAAYAAGAAVVLAKPFELDDFRTVVRAQLAPTPQEDSHG
jgi:two-component system phosphate regulon response regulator PhoB